MYLVVVATFAYPLGLLELTIGQYSGKDAVNVWDMNPAFRGTYCSYDTCMHTNGEEKENEEKRRREKQNKKLNNKREMERGGGGGGRGEERDRAY